MKLRTAICWGLLPGALFFCSPAPAVEVAQLAVGRLQGEGWRLDRLRLGLDLEKGPALSLEAGEVRLQQPPLEARDLSLRCPRLTLYQDGGSRCKTATLSLKLAPWKEIHGGLSWRWQEGRLDLALDELQLGAGRLSGQLHGGGEEGWRGDLHLAGLALAPLLQRWVPGWSGSGRLAGEMAGRWSGGDHWSGRFELQGSGIQFSDAEGLHVGESLAGRLAGSLEGGRNGISGRLQLKLTRGQLYLDPFYLELAQPLRLTLAGSGSPDGSRIRLRKLVLDHAGVLHAEGQGSWRASALEVLSLQWRSQALERLYATLLQPLLIGTAADNLQLSGQGSGRLVLEQGEPAAFGLKLREVDLEEGSGRYGLRGVTADLSWQKRGAAAPSHLGWRKAHLYRVALGEASMRLQAQDGRIEVEPFSVALLGGRLRLARLELSGLPGGPFEAEGGASLEKASLEALSRALQWPRLQGTLNATLPRLHYREGRLQLEGDLVLELFGGRVVVEGLVIEELLGPAPVLQTSIRLENLDLAQISRTFSFGRIEGSLEGEIRNLRLVGWEVAAFDAELRSPRHDRRRHRISQRAIDDLTELGNGVAAGLSGTFLGIFKDFAYDRLELRVKLQGDTAELDGAPGPGGGYYIVKGALLPRVDVIGRNRRVAWKDLLNRLENIRLKGIVVE